MVQLKIFLLTLLLLFTAGCGAKVSSKQQDPVVEAALVYIYVTLNSGYNEATASSKYKIRINGKRVDQTIQENEYIAFNLIPQLTNISVTRAQIEEQSVDLQLQAGEIYFLRVKSDLDNGGFEFEEIKKSIGMQEITRTELSGLSMPEEDAVITDTDTSSKQHKLSKTDQITKAHKLKEDGIISEEEFKALKADILAK